MKILFKRVGLILLVIANVTISYTKEPVEIMGAKQIFQKYNVDGSILIFDRNKDEYCGHNLERCNIGFCPASTFKISNTLIALETGVITMDSVFRWNGEKRRYLRWEADMNITEAFQVSNVPIYQGIARSIGLDRMREYVRLLHYGEMDINAGNLDNFWLEGHSQITQYQQIYFLTGLYDSTFPLNPETMDNVKEIMLLEETNDYKLRGKTGWAEIEGKDIGWFVGYFETTDNVYFFATNIEPKEQTDMSQFGQIRIDLTKEIVSLLMLSQHELFGVSPRD